MDELTLPPIQIGKIKNLPKGTPKWIWRCACDECEQRPIAETLRGPFRTRRDALRDVEQTFILTISEPQGSA
jgi:hypothetical protein